MARPVPRQLVQGVQDPLDLYEFDIYVNDGGRRNDFSPFSLNLLILTRTSEKLFTDKTRSSMTSVHYRIVADCILPYDYSMKTDEKKNKRKRKRKKRKEARPTQGRLDKRTTNIYER